MKKLNQINIGFEAAVEIYTSEIWKQWTPEQLVLFQMFASEVSVPFTVFHKALEKVLERPVWIHELRVEGGAKIWEELTAKLFSNSTLK